MPEKIILPDRADTKLQPIRYIQNKAQLPCELRIKAHEFTWNCPSVMQPDFGVVSIQYIPNKRIAETKTLKFYLAQYRDASAFAEELAHAILRDFVYYIQPKRARVWVDQNSRGGILNTATYIYNENTDNTADFSEYNPRQNSIFSNGNRGSWNIV